MPTEDLITRQINGHLTGPDISMACIPRHLLPPPDIWRRWSLAGCTYNRWPVILAFSQSNIRPHSYTECQRIFIIIIFCRRKTCSVPHDSRCLATVSSSEYQFDIYLCPAFNVVQLHSNWSTSCSVHHHHHHHHFIVIRHDRTHTKQEKNSETSVN